MRIFDHFRPVTQALLLSQFHEDSELLSNLGVHLGFDTEHDMITGYLTVISMIHGYYKPSMIYTQNYMAMENYLVYLHGHGKLPGIFTHLYMAQWPIHRWL